MSDESRVQPRDRPPRRGGGAVTSGYGGLEECDHREGESPADVRVLEAQRRIEHCFKAVLHAPLDDPEVAHLRIVSHSQGTMIAIDVLSLTGLSPDSRRR
jgi:hypothetical protein